MEPGPGPKQTRAAKGSKHKRGKNSERTSKAHCETRNISEIHVLILCFSRHQGKDGKYKKRSSDQDRAEAAETLQQYHSLTQEDKSSFATTYSSNKDKKDFQWARDFIQKVNVSKVDEEACNSKYMTRNSIELGHGSNFHEAAKWKNQLFVATSLSFVYSLHAFQA